MKRISVILIALLSVFAAVAQTSQFHYFCGFETPQDTVGWRFGTGRKVKTIFTVGKATHRIGAKSMYVSADDGATAGYISTISGFTTVAYRKFTLEAGTYDINFDLYIAGQAPTFDVFRLAYFPVYDAGGVPRVPEGAAGGATFPPLARMHPFVDENGVMDFVNFGWRNVRGKLNIPVAGEYWLAFYFKESGGLKSETNPGACIDNIQILPHALPNDCLARVSPLNVVKRQTVVDITWKGNAPQYELLYYNVSNPDDTTYTLVSGLTTPAYSIALNSVPEGCYNFRVRPICAPDTGAWEEKANVLVYDPAAHCLDYLNFNAKGVKCYTGQFLNPYEKEGVVDHGPEARESVHTVHHRSDEYDRLTGNELKTVPEGAIASVRLSSWAEGPASSGAIEYTYTVQPYAKVLLLRYAAVLQYEAGHTKPEEQTRIHVEILDTAGKLLSSCTEADFNALDVSQGNTRGWKTYQPKEGEVQLVTCPIKWLDWTTLGINLKDYIGQEVRIRLTLYACVANLHFAYAYFVLDCSRGDIEGMSCGEVPNHFTVSEGFDYRWYRMLDGEEVPEDQLSDGGRTFTPLDGDTASYYVDLMYPGNHDCKFTLNAYMLPRVPRSEMSYGCSTRGCQNIVDFANHSGVYSYPKDEPEILRPDTIDTYLWDFGEEYGTSQEKNPQLVVPLEGDTFTVSLQTGYNNCYDVKEFEVRVPAARGESFGIDTAYICEGESVVFNGKEYDSPGDYTDTLHTVYGCDSIISLHLKVLVSDSIVTDTVVCSDEVLEFFGQRCDTTGTYIHRVPSSLGCDTLYYEMHLTVLDALEATLATPADICSSGTEEPFLIPYTVTQGVVSAFSVDYDPTAEAAGFVDTDSVAIAADTTVLTLTKPATIRPGHYSATVTLYNSDCGNLVLPLNFDVLYPSSVIAQRWNDALAIKNSGHNGGYTFAAYQWYLDGTPVEGEIRSQLYTENGTLRFGSEYRVLLTRADDGVSVLTCPYTPTEFAYEEYTEVSNVVFPGSAVVMESPLYATATLYTLSGLKHSEQDIVPGINTLTMPQSPGIYILQFRYADTRIETLRIVVK